MGGLLGL
ncbi:hypothetical protein ACHAWF_014614 [Thalassiosira exigua]